MDPNVALESILRGYLIAEHARALELWLLSGGFSPTIRTVPFDCAAFVKAHCLRHYARLDYTTIEVRADRVGLWSAPPDGLWISLGIWHDLKETSDAVFSKN